MRHILLCSALIVGACATQSGEPMTTASLVDPEALQASVAPDYGTYRIGAADLLEIKVFQVPDLSFEEQRVDAAGNIDMPLIRSIQAAGRTPAELSRDIEARLGAAYLQNPQVAVSVKEAASQKVVVDGDVTKPGAYQLQGRTTLLQAVAMAEGPTRTANLSNVAIFRTVDGQRLAAVFDLEAVREGRAADPTVQGEDVIVVDQSRLRAVWREVISSLPAFNVFRPY